MKSFSAMGFLRKCSSPIQIFPIVLFVPRVRLGAGRNRAWRARENTLYFAPLASVTGVKTPWRKLLDVDDDVIAADVHGTK